MIGPRTSDKKLLFNAPFIKNCYQNIAIHFRNPFLSLELNRI